MPEYPAKLLAQWTRGEWTAEPASAVSAFCTDSRQLRPGDAFVALRTDKRDGHDFLAAAAAAGAGAAVVSVPNSEVALAQLVVADPLIAFQTIAREHRRRFEGRVVGVTGSAGKTSTKDLLALLLGGVCGAEPPFPGRVLATEGNLNNHIGVPLTLTRIDPAKHDIAVIEAGISAPGEMDQLAGMIEPDVAIVTLIAPAHTEELGGIDGVAREKSRLASAVRAGGVAIFSRETADFRAFRELPVPALTLERAGSTDAGRPGGGAVAFSVAQEPDRTVVTLPGEDLVFLLRRMSEGMAQNAALAIQAALWLGVPATTIQARLAAWRPAKLRGEIRRDRGRLLYLDCYNANPASMADALSTFCAISPATDPRLFVIGCMEELGRDSSSHHTALGRSLHLRPDDQVFVIGEQADAIVAGATQAGIDVARQLHVAPSAESIAEIVRLWRGAVFVKGSRRYRLENVLVKGNVPGSGETHSRPSHAATNATPTN